VTDTLPPDPRASSPVRLLVALAVLGVLVSIAVWLWLGNAGAARECPVQPEDAAAIDAAATGELAALLATGEGRGYSTLSFTDAQGAPVSIADFKGKALLVNFWATWCVPCREEMPYLDALATKYNSDDFMVLPINLDVGADGIDKAEAFLAEGGLANLPLYADNTFAAFDRLRQEAVAIGLPATLVLDENGCELGVLQGPAHWDTPDGERIIETMIGLVG
jgi:thiol-disulfide isomerase/thioredoxin